MKQATLTLLAYLVQILAQLPLLLILAAIVPLCDLFLFVVNIVITLFNKVSIFIAILKDEEFRKTLRQFAEIGERERAENVIDFPTKRAIKRTPRGFLLGDREG